MRVHKTSEPYVWFLLLQTSVIYVINYLQFCLCCSFPGYLVIGRANRRRKCKYFLIIAFVFKITDTKLATNILSLKVAKTYSLYFVSINSYTH
jgi:hypothetical protein